MKRAIFLTFFFGILFSPFVSAHGDESPETIAKRNAFTSEARRSLSACSSKLKERGLHAARIERREDLVERHFGEARRKHKRGLAQVSISEKEPGKCILAPEEIIGPYYLTTSLLRQDIRTSPLQKGIEFVLVAQLVDVNTCNLVKGVTAEFWHANYMGVYSGFKVQGTLGEDYHRGFQTSGESGTVEIVTYFPGWYPGRAVHIHIAAHLNGTLVPNDQEVGSAKSGEGLFYTGGTVPHIGQLYFPEDVLDQVEKTAPYTEHSDVPRLKNDKDVFYQGSGADVQIVNVRFVEDRDISKGLVGDVIVGIDLSKNYTAQPSDPNGGDEPSSGGTTQEPLSTTTGSVAGTPTGTTETGQGLGLSTGMMQIVVALGLGWLLGI